MATEWQSIEERYRLAEQAIAVNDYEKAHRLLAELTQEYPNEALFHCASATCSWTTAMLTVRLSCFFEPLHSTLIVRPLGGD